MDDFELFRARSMHGGVLRKEQSPVEHSRYSCLNQQRGRKCRLASTSKASATPANCLNVASEDNAGDCRTGTHTSKFGTRRDDVVAMPEVVRCSNAWVDFSATELPVRKMDRGQKSDRWHRPRNAWMPRSEPSFTGFTFSDQSATHEFDIYRLRSFATAAGRIVNRGDYFRVRQRIHPTDAEQMEHFRGPIQTVSDNSKNAAPASPSNSTTYQQSTIEYRPVVYYATNNCDAAAADDDDEETVVEDNEEDCTNEKTKLLADHGRRTNYFSRIRHRSRSGGEERGSHTRLLSRDQEDDGGNSPRSPSTEVPNNEVELFRVTSVIRVVVLGDRGVGKTTLARQLLTSEHLANSSVCFNFTQGKSSSLVRT